jgi:hypothetical protein
LIFALSLSILIALLGHSCTQDSQPVHLPLSTCAGIQLPFQKPMLTVLLEEQNMISSPPAISTQISQICRQTARVVALAGRNRRPISVNLYGHEAGRFWPSLLLLIATCYKRPVLSTRPEDTQERPESKWRNAVAGLALFLFDSKLEFCHLLHRVL